MNNSNCNNNYNLSNNCSPCNNGRITSNNMPNLIDCASLEFTMATLKQKFKTCAVLSAEDMDIMVDVLYSVEQCTTTSEGLFNNVIVSFELPNVETTTSSVASQINILPQFTIDETNIAFFNVTVDNVASVYALKPGKGSYGAGGSILLGENDVLKISGITEINNLNHSVIWANVPDENITESSVVQHEGAITITESQISDLQHVTNNDELINGAGYITSADDNLRTEEEIRDIAASQWIDGENTTVIVDDTGDTIKIDSQDTTYSDLSEFNNDVGYLTDYTVTEEDVTNHEDAITISESQIDDLHIHDNKQVIDKFGENSEGYPTYNGNNIDTTIAQRDVYDGLDSTDNTISLAATQGKVLKDTQDLQQIDINLNNVKISNVQADWNATSGLAVILNKPVIPTVPTNLSEFNNDVGYITDYTVTENDVTQYETNLVITESQISDLQHVTNNDQLINGAGYITSFTDTQRTDEEIRDIASDQWVDGENTTVIKDDLNNTIKIDAVDTNTQRSDADIQNIIDTNTAGFITGYTVTEADVTQHQSALVLTESQISDLIHVTNNNQILNGAGYIKDYTVTQSDVTQHQSALTITESQISDLTHFSGDYNDLDNLPSIPSVANFVEKTGDIMTGALSIDATGTALSVPNGTSEFNRIQLDNNKFLRLGTSTSGNGFNPTILFNSGSNSYLDLASSDSSFYIRDKEDSNSFRFTFTRASGRLGIGTTTPQAKLDVKGYDVSAVAKDVLIVSGQMSTDVYDEGLFAAKIRTYSNYNSLGNGSQGGLLVQAGFGKNIDIARFSAIGAGYVDVPRLVIKDTGNVGIGTTDPSAKLELKNEDSSVGQNCELYITQQKTYGAGNGLDEKSKLIFAVTDSTQLSSNRQMASIEASPSSEASSANGFMTLNTRSSGSLSEAMRIDNNGNVGIGTASPTEKLEVDGNIKLSGDINLESQRGLNVLRGNASSIMDFDFPEITNAAGTFRIGRGTNTTSTLNTVFYKGSEVAVQINHRDKKLGIGKNPTANLDVNGDAIIEDDLNVNGDIYIDGVIVKDVATTADYNDLINTPTIPTTDDFVEKTGDIMSGALRTRSTINQFGLGVYNNDGTTVSGFYDDNSNMQMFLRDSTNMVGAVIKSNGSSFLNGGNVGIGTDNPVSKLDVRFTGELGRDRIARFEKFTTGDNAYLDIFADNQNNTVEFISTGTLDGGFKFGNSGNNNQLVINNDNVGIGTADPDNNLSIESTSPTIELSKSSGSISQDTEIGKLLFTADDDSSGRVREDTGYIRQMGTGNWNSSASNSYLGFGIRNNNSTFLDDTMVLDHNGNVGIGTASPDTKLHVKGDSFDVATFERDSATSSSTIFIKNNIGDGCAIQGTGGGGGMSLATVTSGGGFVEKMRIRPSGNVGIGTNDPDEKLEVNGNIKADDFILSSDKNLKENVKDFDKESLDINVKTYELKSAPGVKRTGVIAQELEVEHPEFVRTNDKGVKSVAYIDLLMAKIAELEARLEKLEK